MLHRSFLLPPSFTPIRHPLTWEKERGGREVSDISLPVHTISRRKKVEWHFNKCAAVQKCGKQTDAANQTVRQEPPLLLCFFESVQNLCRENAKYGSPKWRGKGRGVNFDTSSSKSRRRRKHACSCGTSKYDTIWDGFHIILLHPNLNCYATV